MQFKVKNFCFCLTAGADVGTVKTCEFCKQDLVTDVDNSNVNAHYRNHQQSWVRNCLSSDKSP